VWIAAVILSRYSCFLQMSAVIFVIFYRDFLLSLLVTVVFGRRQSEAPTKLLITRRPRDRCLWLNNKEIITKKHSTQLYTSSINILAVTDVESD